MKELVFRGGQPAATRFRAIWCVDFEFNGEPGERPRPVCMVAREFWSGKELRYWRDDLRLMSAPPFEIDDSSLFVAYYASAEIGCFLELGWQPPVNVLDLFTEHRVETNGLPVFGNGLLGALTLRGLAHMDAGEKEDMRRLILDQDSWNAPESAEILDYCASDVLALDALLPNMAPAIDLPRALFRGRYMAAVARMERTGIPVDARMYRTLAEDWPELTRDLIAKVDEAYGVYEDGHFRIDRFAKYLRDRAIPWPRTASGRLQLTDDVFREKARLHAELPPLQQLRSTLAGTRLIGLTVGSDGRNRCLLSPFSSVTGRNQPSNKRFIFGPASWMRHLIVPEDGYGLAYIDFASQEIGIAAALSGDQKMIDGYLSGDPYLAFAKAAGLAPAEATAQSHRLIRDRCKQVVLGLNYGMGADAMAEAAGIRAVDAAYLIRLHKENYPMFWRYSQSAVDSATLSGEIGSVFGWKRRVMQDTKATSLMNFPMQANGAEMMRAAAIAATEAGISVCAPVHDAFLISAPLSILDEHVARMRSIMARAGKAVTGGVPIRTEASVYRYPERFSHPKSEAMWQTITSLARRFE
jgi:hypothetical protein